LRGDDGIIKAEVEFGFHFFGNYKEPSYHLKLEKEALLDLKESEHLVCDIKLD